ncbi:MAG: PDGLE domain-containing protein [Candidatus Eisenbacteria bacterium]|nr:PDGLE domain-containing protein [Candidatus Eisenbacteria bacterium]
MSERKVLVLSFVVSLVLAGLVSPYASRLPDGLERIAGDLGFIDRERALLRSPAPDYSWQGLLLGKLPASLAGIAGAALVFAAAALLGKVLTAAELKHETR